MNKGDVYQSISVGECEEWDGTVFFFCFLFFLFCFCFVFPRVGEKFRKIIDPKRSERVIF